MIPHTNPPPPKPMKQIIMPSRSPPSTPHSNVNHPHLVYYGPLSNSPEQSIVTVPDSPTHQDKNVQTSTKQIIVQNVSIQTLPNPPFTLQQKEPPNLPTLLQLGDLLWDPKLFTPMITHYNVHSPILNLYKSFRQTMNLKTYQEIETIKIPIQSSIIHALYQLNALPFLIALKEALTKHGRKTFCIQCYHLGHFWKDCPFYRCLYCCLIWPKHDKTYASTIQNILDQPLSNRNPHHPLPSKSYHRLQLPRTVQRHCLQQHWWRTQLFSKLLIFKWNFKYNKGVMLQFPLFLCTTSYHPYSFSYLFGPLLSEQTISHYSWHIHIKGLHQHQSLARGSHTRNMLH